MFTENKIVLGVDRLRPEEALFLSLEMVNRHGLIAGATGTGKTVSLKVFAESLSDAGIPVLLADVKGDLAGMCRPGEETEDMKERISRFGITDFTFDDYPVHFWDVFGKGGMPLRTTMTEFGPLLLARLLGLNQIQSDILNIVFKIADDEGLLLIDTKDLKAMLNFVADNGDLYRAEYGNVAKQSVSAIMRALVSLEDKGGELFFGEPALDIHDWMKIDERGKGYINIIDSSSLISDSLIYSTFMLWMLSELFEVLPEVGDARKPKLVFFFDEAHLLFKGTSKALLEKIEQVVKLIRSKGIGIYFITQNPADIPDGVLAQLGNKIQHALRAYSPTEQRAVKAAAMSYRPNPAFKTEEAITQLGIGEAIVSFIAQDGSPTMVRQASILPPRSKMGSLDAITRQAAILASPLREKYQEDIDRDSAYEFFVRKQEEDLKAEEALVEQARLEKEEKILLREQEKERQKKEKEEEREKKKMNRRIATVAGSAAGTVGRELGNTLGKSVGGTFGKRLGGNVGASLGRGLLKTLFKL